MKKFTKLFAFVLTIAMCICMFATTANAAIDNTGTISISAIAIEAGFQNSWELSIDVYCVALDLIEIGVIVFGYDTTLINEDYTWTKAYVGSSEAGVFRDGYDTQYSWGPTKSADRFSKIEVTHKTDKVYYLAKFSTIGQATPYVSDPYDSNIK